MSVFVKQHGSQRTGTCYCTAMLRLNFDCHVFIHDLGDKHQPPADYMQWLNSSEKRLPNGTAEAITSGQLRQVATIKDPYAWAVSYNLAQTAWKNPYSRRYKEDPVGAFAGRLEAYNNMYNAFVNTGRKYVLVLRYEDFLDDFRGVLRKMQERLDLVPKGPFQNIENKMTPNDSVGRRRFDPTYYTSKAYLKLLSPGVMNLITQKTDWGLMRLFGYFPLA